MSMRFLPSAGIDLRTRTLVSSVMGGMSASVLTGCAAVIAFALGSVVARSPAFGIAGAFAVFLLGLSVADLGVVPSLCIPATMIIYRLGGGASSLSVSDFVLFVGSVCVLVIARFGGDRTCGR